MRPVNSSLSWTKAPVVRILAPARGRGALREARRFHSTAQHELVKTLGERQVAAARAVLRALAADRATEPLNWCEDRPF